MFSSPLPGPPSGMIGCSCCTQLWGQYLQCPHNSHHCHLGPCPLWAGLSSPKHLKHSSIPRVGLSPSIFFLPRLGTPFEGDAREEAPAALAVARLWGWATAQVPTDQTTQPNWGTSAGEVGPATALLPLFPSRKDKCSLWFISIQ